MIYVPIKLDEFVPANVGKFSIHGASGKCIIPLTIDPSLINFSQIRLVNRLSKRTGAPPCMIPWESPCIAMANPISGNSHWALRQWVLVQKPRAFDR